MDRRERAGYVGATDISAILNIPPYGCARRLWYDKKLFEQDYPEDREALFALGHALEPECKRRYAERTGATFKDDPQAYRAAGIPDWLNAHPDGVIEHRARSGLGSFEAKTFSGHAWSRMAFSDGMPQAYILQIQCQLLQTGFSWAVWACLSRETGEFLSFDVDRDQKLIRDIASATADWWDQCMVGDATPMGWHDRCREDKAPCARCPWRHTCLGGKNRSAIEELAEKRRLRGDLPDCHDERLGRLVARREGLRGPRDRANSAWDHLNEAIRNRLSHLCTPDGVCLSGRRVTAHEQIRSSWDEDAMRSAGVDVGRFKVPGKASRPLRVGKEKG